MVVVGADCTVEPGKGENRGEGVNCRAFNVGGPILHFTTFFLLAFHRSSRVSVPARMLTGLVLET